MGTLLVHMIYMDDIYGYMDEALVDLKKLYLKNEYPSKLIDNIISDIKAKNFQTNTQKEKIKNDIKNNPDQFFTLILDWHHAVTK